jgi:hypothetical protein
LRFVDCHSLCELLFRDAAPPRFWTCRKPHKSRLTQVRRAFSDILTAPTVR